MWLFGGLQAAADVPAPGGASDQLIITVGTVIAAAIVTLGGVLVAVVNSRGAKTAPSPPAATPATSNEHELYERTAVHNKRLDDNDDRFDVIDRARAKDRDDLDDVLDYLDDRDPGWRR